MMKQKRDAGKKGNSIYALAILVSIGLILFAFSAFLTPDTGCASGETAGADLVVRVGYFGEDQDYREKATLSRSQLESLGCSTYYYSNVTKVGTVMGMVAYGPTVESILTATGIDLASVQTLNLRTTDGDSAKNNWFVSLNMDQWVNAPRYYYPALRGNYENVDGVAVLPGEGALAEEEQVPAILAIRSATTKSKSEELSPEDMTEENSYRFCTGQTALEEGVASQEWSSMNSAKWIFGIDVTLYGDPPEEEEEQTDPNDPETPVGSKGDDPTKTEPEEETETEQKTPSAEQERKAQRHVTSPKANADKTIAPASKLREIRIAGSMYDRDDMSEEATALSAQPGDPRAIPIAAGGAGACVAIGALYRLLLFLKEVR